MQTARLANINLFVRDADQAYQFYQHVFGFELEPGMAHPPDFWVLNAGSATLSFQAKAAVGMNQEPVGGIELGVEVADVQATAARLQARGGQIDASNQMSWGESVDGRDLDGHRVTIYRRG
ncbi:VOC family protein [Spirosoma validum]|uniref:VOC family protein n=1 Tax=Spirosoma validum TaxID=2771355 RepID=A0A927B985_9BACT|nr:VOC family protein [Spirosoma validum]MBD2757467.1 VOC family protein [Spirosoma validum]